MHVPPVISMCGQQDYTTAMATSHWYVERVPMKESWSFALERNGLQPVKTAGDSWRQMWPAGNLDSVSCSVDIMCFKSLCHLLVLNSFVTRLRFMHETHALNYPIMLMQILVRL